MWGDMSLWNVQGPLLHSGDTLIQFIVTADYAFNTCFIPNNCDLNKCVTELDQILCGRYSANHIFEYFICIDENIFLHLKQEIVLAIPGLTL